MNGLKIQSKKQFRDALILSFCVLTGCEQTYSITTVKPTSAANAPTSSGTGVTKVANPTPTAAPTATPKVVVQNPTPSPLITPTPAIGPQYVTESFATSNTQTKKIDFLFVIDNSKSMSDNQRKLAQGFEAFADTFFRRDDLDICTMIITSDRYLGKDGSRGYQRERRLPCTQPQGSQNWSALQKQNHINSLINEFKQSVYVGTRGDAVELLGKSLAAFLKEDTAFFRKNAVANITFISDENNYFFDGTQTEEERNDIPYEATPADPRDGIKKYLDTFFAQLNPDRSLNYSTTAILELGREPNTVPGLSTNLVQLASAIGRESKQTDISGSARSYTDVYQSIADAIVLRATNFTLTRAVQNNEIKAELVRTNGERKTLSLNSDFKLENSKSVTLDPKVIPILKADDRIEFTYRYTK